MGALVATREGLLCAVVDSQDHTDPKTARDRIELWLALRARELVA